MVREPFGGFFRNKRVLVTGNTGFKGSWLTAWLLDLGAKVFGISIDIPTEPSLFRIMGLENRIDHYWRDLREISETNSVVNEIHPEVVFHLAAQPVVSRSYCDPVGTVTTNVIGTVSLLEALRNLENPCCAVFITSDKCYHNVEWLWGYRENDPLGGKDIYSASKACAENVIRAYFHSFFKNNPMLKIASARAGNVIGGGDWTENRIVPDCVRSWESGSPVMIRNPDSTRPWQHVLEPLGGYLRLARSLSESENVNGESFNFGPRAEQNVTVEQVVVGLSSYLWEGSPAAAYRVERADSFSEAGLLKLNCDKALSLLGWSSVLDYSQTIDMTGTWYRSYLDGKQENMYQKTIDQIEDYENLARCTGWLCR